MQQGKAHTSFSARLLPSPSTASSEVDAYHVRFATRTIGPNELPEFAYTCAVVYYDHIVYVAVMRSPSLDGVVNQVRRAWPDALIHKIVKGRDRFIQEDELAAKGVLGVMAEIRPKSKTKRLFYFFFPSMFS